MDSILAIILTLVHPYLPPITNEIVFVSSDTTLWRIGRPLPKYLIGRSGSRRDRHLFELIAGKQSVKFRSLKVA